LAVAANASRPRESIATDPVHLPVTSPGDEVEREAKQAESRPAAHLDFTNIRVHTDAKAAQAAQALHARAFTVGGHMVFGAGEFAPHRDEGRRLLAHELAHARQPGSENRLARAPVEGVQIKGIEMSQADIEKGTEGGFWTGAIVDAFQPNNYDTRASKRFASDPEERDAVLSSVMERKPKGKIASKTVVNLSIDPRKKTAGSKKLLYQVTFSPSAKGVQKDGGVLIQFLEEGSGATAETPAPPADFSASLNIQSPPALVSHLKAHPDEKKQLLFWIENAPAKFSQLVKTKETTASSKVHESWFFLVGEKDSKGTVTSLTVNMMGETEPVMQDPPAGYRDKTRADFDIEKLQGQKKDALGNITFLNSVPPDELLSLKFVIAQYFTGGEGGKTKTRNSEVDVSIPIAHAAKPTNVDYTLRFQPNNDVEVERVGIPDSKELLKATGMNISRVDGFPAKSTAASFASWVKTRYPSVKVTGTKLTDMQDSVNKDMAAHAGTTPWFFDNYGITILDPGAAASRLTSVHNRVHNRKVDQTAGLTGFKPEELKSLEFALETMSAEELKLLRDVRFARQKVALDLKVDGKRQTIKLDPSAGGETFQDSGERTIVIYDNVTINDNVLFQGGKRGVRQKSVEAYSHELGHALGSQNNLEKAFKAFVKSHGINPISSYAASDVKQESFPEAFAYYQTDPEWMQNNLPDLYNWFDYVKKNGSAPPTP
jgi:hypothetical protein